eukprot:gene7907-biopygen14026
MCLAVRPGSPPAPPRADHHPDAGGWRGTRVGDSSARCSGARPVITGGHSEPAGGWRLEVGGWRLEAGGWRVEVGGWRLEGEGGSCKLEAERLPPHRPHPFPSSSCRVAVSFRRQTALQPDPFPSSDCAAVRLPRCSQTRFRR